MEIANPASGSWRIVQSQPTGRYLLQNPASGSWRIVQSQPTGRYLLQNPASGSWRIVQSQPTWAEFFLPLFDDKHILSSMQPTYTKINWAYQLHYYLSFRTHRRRKYFAEPACSEKLAEIVAEICQRRDYHLLESKTY